jgi:hypothetical protein
MREMNSFSSPYSFFFSLTEYNEREGRGRRVGLKMSY